MAADRFDGPETIGWVLEQGARFLHTVTVDEASPNVTAAVFSVRENVDSATSFLSVSQADDITIANNASDYTLTIDISAVTTAALTGTASAYWYDLEVTQDSDTSTTVKIMRGWIPWEREPGGAT